MLMFTQTNRGLGDDASASTFDWTFGANTAVTDYCTQNPSANGCSAPAAAIPSSGDSSWFSGFNPMNWSGSSSSGSTAQQQQTAANGGSSGAWGAITAALNVTGKLLAPTPACPYGVVAGTNTCAPQPWYTTPVGIGAIVLGLGALYMMMNKGS